MRSNLRRSLLLLTVCCSGCTGGLGSFGAVNACPDSCRPPECKAIWNAARASDELSEGSWSCVRVLPSKTAQDAVELEEQLNGPKSGGKDSSTPYMLKE